MAVRGKNSKFWTRVEINVHLIRQDISIHRDQVIKQIEKHTHPRDLDVFGTGLLTGKETSLKEALDVIFKKKPDMIFLLSCLREFMQRRSAAIDDVAKYILGKDFARVKESTSTFGLLYKLHENHPKSITDIYIRDLIEKKGFERYKAKTTLVSRPKTNLNQIDENGVNMLLSGIDKKLNDEKKSRCWYVIQYGGVTEMYIRREDDPSLLAKLEDNVHDILAKSTIFRFHKHAREVDVWSETHQTAKSILGHLGKKLFDLNTEYVPLEYRNEADKVNQFLRSVAEERDSKLALLGIDRRNTPIEGSPEIKIQSEDGIASALKQLAERGIDIVDDAAVHTKSIRIQFGVSTVHLSFKTREGKVLLLPKYRRGTRSSTHELDDYLKQKYDIRISLGSD